MFYVLSFYCFFLLLVSLETVDGDFETLQQGLKVVEEEQQRDAHNFILFISSFTHTCMYALACTN